MKIQTNFKCNNIVTISLLLISFLFVKCSNKNLYNNNNYINNKSNIVTDTDKFKTIGPYSIFRETNGIIFVSGQIAINPTDGKLNNKDFETELLQIFENIDSILENLSLNKSKINLVNVYLADINDFEKFNKLYAEYFEFPYPARVTVEVSKLPKDAKIELSFIAVR